MKEDRLILDNEKQSSLRDETKFLVEEILSYVIEVFEGKPIGELALDASYLEKIAKYRMFKNKDLVSESSNRSVIEYTEAVKLLHDYYSGDPYGKEYINLLSKKNKDNVDFDEQSFRKEYKNRCEKERYILDALRIERNENYGHAIERANMGEIYLWIRQMMKYIELFLGYRIQILSQYDERLLDCEYSNQLESYYTKASELKNKCFDNKSECKEFRFGKNTYIVSKSDDDRDDFGLLMNDMAKRWTVGIDYLRSDEINKEFISFLKENFDDYDVIMKYEKLRNELISSENGSIDESMIYMSVLFLLFPFMPGIYWKGVLYSDSYFASIVLQMLSRHPNKMFYTKNHKQDLEEKIQTLKYRIDNSVYWDKNSEKQKGIGIAVIPLCERGILSTYFQENGDLRGCNLAKEFEKRILESESMEEDVSFGEQYNRTIISIIALTAYMRGKMTYMLPVPREETDSDHPSYDVFSDPKEFGDYFVKYANRHRSIEEILAYVQEINDDTNFRWWINNYDSFNREDA